MRAASSSSSSSSPGAAAGIVTVVLTLVGWSSIPLFLRHFAEQIDFWTSNGWRYGFSALVWAPVLVMAAMNRGLPRGLWIAAIIPSIVNAAGQVCFTWAHYRIDPGLLTFGLRSQLLFVAIGAWIMFPQERPILKHPGYLVGTALLVAGMIGVIAMKSPADIASARAAAIVSSHVPAADAQHSRILKNMRMSSAARIDAPALESSSDLAIGPAAVGEARRSHILEDMRTSLAGLIDVTAPNLSSDVPMTPVAACKAGRSHILKNMRMSSAGVIDLASLEMPADIASASAFANEAEHSHVLKNVRMSSAALTESRSDTFGTGAAWGARGAYVQGVGLALLSGMLFAAYGLAVRKYMHGVNPVLAFAAICQYTAAAMVGLMLMFGESFGLTALAMTGDQMAMLLGSALIGIAIGHVFYYFSLARLGVAVTAGVLQLQPFIVAVASIFLFQELLNAWQWTGGCIAVAGAMMMLAVQWRLTQRKRITDKPLAIAEGKSGA